MSWDADFDPVWKDLYPWREENDIQPDKLLEWQKEIDQAED